MPEDLPEINEDDLIEQARQCSKEGVRYLHTALNEFLAICYDEYDFRVALVSVVMALEYLLSENKEFLEKLLASKDFADLKNQYGMSDEQLQEGEMHFQATRVRIAAKSN